MAVAAPTGASVGGNRNDSLRVVCGRSTLPALRKAGRPSAPVTLSVGRQLLLSSSSNGSFETGRIPGINGNLAYTDSPSTVAAAFACARRSGGMDVFSSSIRIAPEVASSTRASSSRRMRKLDGTTPLAVPEWTPSASTSTRSDPIRLPRSEVVHHSCS
jgi:hypothetical protein